MTSVGEKTGAGGEPGADGELGADEDLGDARSETPKKESWWSALRPLVLRLHFYAGVLVAPFLLVAATTGLLYVFTPQMEQVVHSHALHVPASSAEQPLAAQVAAARAAHPQGNPSMVWPAQTPTDTTRVIFDPPALPESFYRTVFVNPHNGEVREILETYGDGQSLPVRTWFDQLHRNLHLGTAGRVYTELAASWLWVIVLGGAALWLGRRRPAQRIRRIFAPRVGARGRQRLMSWHGAIGIWVGTGLLFLSATGLTWSLFAGENVSAIKESLDSETPVVSTSAAPAGTGGDVGIDRVVDVARTNGLSGPIQVTLPVEEGEAYSVKQTRRQWPTQQDEIAVQAGTGRVTDMVRFEDYPLLAKLSRWGIDAHMGLLFGWVNQLALALLITCLLTTIVLSYRMWWHRRPTRGIPTRGTPNQGNNAPFGPLPARSVWRRVPGRVLAPIVLGVAFVGYLFPLLGISLAAFLVLDVVLERRKARRPGTTIGVRP